MVPAGDAGRARHAIVTPTTPAITANPASSGQAFLGTLGGGGKSLMDPCRAGA